MLSLKDSWLNRYGAWVVLATLIAIQFYFFKTYLYQKIIGYFPANHDQAVYLPFTYGIFESLKKGNILSSFSSMFSALPTGIFFPVNALVSLFLGEPARFGALLPNWIYFILFQLFAFWTVKSITGKNYLAFILVGLTLGINTPFLIPGGIGDFRMDFIAFCLYGIFATSVIKSQVFLDRKWAIITALFAALMILMRCITAVYFVMTLGILFLSYASMFFFSISKKTFSKSRLINIVICGLIVAAVVAPCILINKQALYDYYVVGHITGAERPFRELTAGTKFLEYILFYPDSVFNSHIGTPGWNGMLYLAVFYIAVYLLLRVISWRLPRNISTAKISLKNEVFFLVLAILCPLIVLTLDPAKSTIVGSIVVLPFIWLVMLLYLFLDQKIFTFSSSSYLKWIVNTVATIILMSGMFQQWHSYMGRKNDQEKLKDYATITKMYLDIGDYATSKHWSKVILSNDQIMDSINYGCLKALYYESRGRLLDTKNEILGGTIFAMSKETALASIAKSNVAILTIGKYPDKQLYPFYASVASYRDDLKKYADEHFMQLGDYSFLGYQYRVYVAN